MVTADVELKVKMPPIISEDVALLKRVIAGEAAELLCEATGNFYVQTNCVFVLISNACYV